MAGVKRLWRKYREYRGTKRLRSCSSGSSKDGMELDETAIMVDGLGLDLKQEEEYVEYRIADDDPRFIDNPHGIGCSKTYEERYVSVIKSPPRSPASMHPLMPQGAGSSESHRLPSFPNLGVWRSASIDMVKGKRKGRMPGDSPEDRYKSLFDGCASR